MGNTCIKDKRWVENTHSPVARRVNITMEKEDTLKNYWHNDKISDELSDKENVRRVVKELGL